MKTFLTSTVAALVLMGAAADANAFGIIISFGGFHRHHVGRHHYGSTSHARSTTTREAKANRAPQSTREAKTESIHNSGTHHSSKGETLALAEALSGEQRAADAAWQTYLNLPKAFRDSIGPVGIFTYASIADFRRISQAYEAADGAEGYSAPVMFKNAKNSDDFYCRVNLIPQTPSELPSVLVHELKHCADFRYKIGHSMPLMEAFFLDSTKETKAKLIEDGFGYFTTEPQEAFAQAISHYLVSSERIDYAKWEADWPHLNAHVRKLLDNVKIAYISPKSQATAADVANSKSQAGLPTTTELPGAASAAVATVPVLVAPLDY